MSSQPLRTSVLASFPWSTDTVVMKSDLAKGFGPDDSPGELIRASEILESEVPRGMAGDIRQIHDENPAEFRLFSEVRGNHKTLVKRLISLLTVYRAIDVRSWIGNNCSESVPLFPRLPKIGHTQGQTCSGIDDWTTVLREARTNLGKADFEIGNSPGPFNFAHSICRMVRGKNRAQAFLNFQVAAMHLSYLSEGHPDLPDRTDVLFKQLSGKSTPLTEGDIAVVIREMSKTTQPLRLPLHVALFASPVFLFVSKSLHVHDWDRKSLIMTFRALGNGKPEWLKYVEKMLWKILFQMADGANVVTTIQSCLSNIPWDSLDSLPDAEKKWFQVTKEFDIWDSPGISEVRIEGDLPTDWPIIGAAGSSLEQGDLPVDQPLIGAAGSSLKRKDCDRGADPHVAKKICLTNPDSAEENKEEEEESDDEDVSNNNMDTEPDAGVHTRMLEESTEGAQGGNAEGDGGSHGNRSDKERVESGDEEENNPGQGGEKDISTDEGQQLKSTSAVRPSRESAGAAAQNSAGRKTTAPIPHKFKQPSARKSALPESSDEEGKNREEDSDEEEEPEVTSVAQPSPKPARKYVHSESSDDEESDNNQGEKSESSIDEDQEPEITSVAQPSPKPARKYVRSGSSDEKRSDRSQSHEESDISTNEDQAFKGNLAALISRKPIEVAARNSAARKPATLIAQKPNHQPTRKSARLDGPARPSSSDSKVPIRRKDNQRKFSQAARPFARTSLADGDSIFRPIDLTKLDDPTLDHLATPEKHVGPVYCVFGPQGERFEIKPTSHCQDELKKLLAILDAVTNKYVGGQPLHISRPEDSTFAIFPEKEFNLLHGRAVLDTLRAQNIVVTGRECSPVEFDLKSLSKLRLLTRVDTIQDQSINPGKNFNYNLRNVQGTLLQMHACASIPDDAGKILNALDCPMGNNANLMCNGFTSDLHAWWATQRLLDCGANKPLPAEDIRWGLAATSGASHWFHIDSDGFGTYIDVQTGGKLWIVARPKIDGGSRADFAKVDILLPPNFDISAPCTAQWDLEAVFLTPGTRLIMRPNTPHAVYTQGHAICHGGHFYATSCLQDTLYSLIHSFVAGSVVTNTEHRASRFILHRMVQFYHHAHTNNLGSGPGHREDYADHMLPLHTMNGVLDLFSICILTETSNILNLQTYDGGMSLEDRKHCVEARHRSRDLLSWFFSRYELVRGDTVLDGYKDVYLRFLARVMIALVKCKKLATIEKIRQLGKCTTAAVNNQVNRCFEGVQEYHTAAAYWDGKEVDSFAWPSDAEHTFGVEPLSKPKERHIVLNGLTADDEIYEKQHPL